MTVYPMSQTTVHIGIVTYNSMADLPSCINSIQAQTYPHITLMIVDNASTDGSWEWIQQNVSFAKQRCNIHNVGFGRAHNQIIHAIDFAPQDVYLVLNPDVVLASDYIEKLLAGMQLHQADWATGKLLLPNSQSIYSVGHALLRGGYAFNIGYGMPDDERFSVSREVFGAPATALMMSIDLLQAIRCAGAVYDEAMFLYAEDVDVDWRARRLGKRCWYIADAVATHRGGQPTPHLYDVALVNRFLMVIKNAQLSDLVGYNLPLMGLHYAFRQMTTPKRGMFILKKLLRHARGAWGLREKTKTAQQMMYWFHWSQQQPTQTPRSYRQRLLSFLLRPKSS